jgi:hypothetical protein
MYILQRNFQGFLHILDDEIACGIHVCVNAHAMIRKFDQPDEIGSYDRWELKLGKKTAPSFIGMVRPAVVFANYKTMVINVDNQGAAKGKTKHRAVSASCIRRTPLPGMRKTGTDCRKNYRLNISRLQGFFLWICLEASHLRLVASASPRK